MRSKNRRFDSTPALRFATSAGHCVTMHANTTARLRAQSSCVEALTFGQQGQNLGVLGWQKVLKLLKCNFFVAFSVYSPDHGQNFFSCCDIVVIAQKSENFVLANGTRIVEIKHAIGFEQVVPFKLVHFVPDRVQVAEHVNLCLKDAVNHNFYFWGATWLRVSCENIMSQNVVFTGQKHLLEIVEREHAVLISVVVFHNSAALMFTYRLFGATHVEHLQKLVNFN